MKPKQGLPVRTNVPPTCKPTVGSKFDHVMSKESIKFGTTMMMFVSFIPKREIGSTASSLSPWHGRSTTTVVSYLDSAQKR